MTIEQESTLRGVNIATMMRFMIGVPQITFAAESDVGKSSTGMEARLEVLRPIELTSRARDLRLKQGHLIVVEVERSAVRGRIQASFNGHEDRYTVKLMVNHHEFSTIGQMLSRSGADKVLEIEFDVSYENTIISLDSEWGSLAWDDAAYPELPFDTFKIHTGPRWIGDQTVDMAC